MASQNPTIINLPKKIALHEELQQFIQFLIIKKKHYHINYILITSIEIDYTNPQNRLVNGSDCWVSFHPTLMNMYMFGFHSRKGNQIVMPTKIQNIS